MQKQGAHRSEWDWMGSEFDYIIENNGTLTQLNVKIDKLNHQLRDRLSSNVAS